MLKFLMICILFWVCVSTQMEQKIKSKDDLKEKFEQFIIEFNRQYKDDNEKALRYSHFVDNLKKADQLNRVHQQDQFGVTKFSDWSEKELKRMLGTKRVMFNSIENMVPLPKFNQGPAPAAFDWRQHNAVTPIKDQGDCGSCWAFSTIGNIEGVYALKHNKLVSLSEQQIVDCVREGEGGCDGGDMGEAMSDLQKSGALVEPESAYPYQAFQQHCNYNKGEGVAQVTGYSYIKSKTDDELKQALYEHGPLSFAMNADALLIWSGKIFPGCNGDVASNHGLVLVGYGTSDSGEDYWIVKNSWGTDWNNGGFFNMKRGVNICDILSNNTIYSATVA